MRPSLVDSSRHNGILNVANLKSAGFVGVIARCTLGFAGLDNAQGNPQDPLDIYKSTRQQCRDLGMMFGAYHVLWPENQAPEDEAEWCDGWIGDDLDGLVLDVELTHGLSKSNVVSQAWDWLQAMDDLRPNLRKWVYTGSWWWTVRHGDLEATYDLHEAEYTRSEPRGGIDISEQPIGDPATLPPGWTDWKFWQWTSGGKPLGAASTSLDYNIFNGTLDELKFYLGLAEPPQPPPADKIEIEVRVPAGKVDVKVEEV